MCVWNDSDNDNNNDSDDDDDGGGDDDGDGDGDGQPPARLHLWATTSQTLMTLAGTGFR